MSRIVTPHRVHSLRYHTLQQVVPRLIILALCDRACPLLEYSTSHTEPTKHWNVPDKPPAQREHCPLRDNIGSVRNHASSLLPQFTVFHRDRQSQHSCVIFQSSGSLHSSPNLARCSLMWVEGITSSLT